MSKPLNLFLAFIGAISAGSIIGIIITALSAPGLYTSHRFIIPLAISSAVNWALLYLSLPLLVLALCSHFIMKPLSLFTCIIVPIIWFFTIFLWWAQKPWKIYQEFPWNAFERHFIELLPVALSAGWVFWKVFKHNSDYNQCNQTTVEATQN
jgi:hypothetical protein